jgi:hypothetical protein
MTNKALSMRCSAWALTLHATRAAIGDGWPAEPPASLPQQNKRSPVHEHEEE